MTPDHRGTGLIGQTLGRYRIVERLGEGGMGVVFRAEDPRLERDVALKILKQDALHDEDSKQRFRLEARALSRLLHPNIATLFDFDSDGGVDFLVLEFVAGESLARMLANGPLAGDPGARHRNRRHRGSAVSARGGHRASRPQAREYRYHAAGAR